MTGVSLVLSHAAPPSRTAATNLAVSNRLSRPKIWLAIFFGVLLIFGVGALFFYFRTSSFVNETLGAYNASSLLTAVPTPTSTTTLQISPTTSQLSRVTTPQPGKAPVLPVIAKPLPSPSPTITADNSPTLIRRIKAGEKISLLVLGYGGEGHDGAYLTDTMLVITYDPVHKAVVMVNIPRYLYVLVPYAGPNSGYWGKINSAFSFIMEGNPDQSILSPRYRFFNGLTKLDAAANLAKDVVEEVTGIPIDYWATFSFESFRRLIDALGGVDVVVDKTFDDYEYPANDNPQIDASYKHIHFQAGFEHMNGERAIEFARSRKSTQDGTDFARSKRQMKLVQAVKDKLAKPEMLLKAPAIMDALQGRIRTSLSASEVTALVDYLHSGEGLAKTKDLLFVSQILNSTAWAEITI